MLDFCSLKNKKRLFKHKEGIVCGTINCPCAFNVCESPGPEGSTDKLAFTYNRLLSEHLLQGIHFSDFARTEKT